MSQCEAIVIGASAGAIEALSSLLPALPHHCRVPVFVVVHLPADRPSLLAEIFRTKVALPVCEAEDKEPIHPGTIYFAPPNYHLLVDTADTLALSNDELVKFSRPSIDVLFESAADVYGPSLLGIILTGANDDGAQGLAAIAREGGMAIVQEATEAQSPMMPIAAHFACPSAKSLRLEEIRTVLQEAVQ